MEVEDLQPNLDEKAQKEAIDMEQLPVLRQQAPKQIPINAEEEMDEGKNIWRRRKGK